MGVWTCKISFTNIVETSKISPVATLNDQISSKVLTHCKEKDKLELCML